jgi:hypothetical protein
MNRSTIPITWAVVDKGDLAIVQEPLEPGRAVSSDHAAGSC